MDSLSEGTVYHCGDGYGGKMTPPADLSIDREQEVDRAIKSQGPPPRKALPPARPHLHKVSKSPKTSSQAGD